MALRELQLVLHQPTESRATNRAGSIVTYPANPFGDTPDQPFNYAHAFGNRHVVASVRGNTLTLKEVSLNLDLADNTFEFACADDVELLPFVSLAIYTAPGPAMQLSVVCADTGNQLHYAAFVLKNPVQSIFSRTRTVFRATAPLDAAISELCTSADSCSAMDSFTAITERGEVLSFSRDVGSANAYQQTTIYSAGLTQRFLGSFMRSQLATAQHACVIPHGDITFTVVACANLEIKIFKTTMDDDSAEQVAMLSIEEHVRGILPADQSDTLTVFMDAVKYKTPISYSTTIALYISSPIDSLVLALEFDLDETLSYRDTLTAPPLDVVSMAVSPTAVCVAVAPSKETDPYCAVCALYGDIQAWCPVLKEQYIADALALPDHKTPREVFCEYLFNPRRFSKSCLQAVAENRWSMQLEDHTYERICERLTTSVEWTIQQCGQTVQAQQYRSIEAESWRALLTDCVNMQRELAVGRPDTLTFNAETQSFVLVSEFDVKLLVPTDAVESVHLRGAAENLSTDISAILTPAGVSAQEQQDVVALLKISAEIRELYSPEIHSMFIQRPFQETDALASTILDGTATASDGEEQTDTTRVLMGWLVGIRTLTRSAKYLLDMVMLTPQAGSTPVDSDIKPFCSTLGVSLFARRMNQIALARACLVRDVLVLFHLALRLPDLNVLSSEADAQSLRTTMAKLGVVGSAFGRIAWCHETVVVSPMRMNALEAILFRLIQDRMPNRTIPVALWTVQNFANTTWFIPDAIEPSTSLASLADATSIALGALTSDVEGQANHHSKSASDMDSNGDDGGSQPSTCDALLAERALLTVKPATVAVQYLLLRGVDTGSEIAVSDVFAAFAAYCAGCALLQVGKTQRASKLLRSGFIGMFSAWEDDDAADLRQLWHDTTRRDISAIPSASSFALSYCEECVQLVDNFTPNELSLTPTLNPLKFELLNLLRVIWQTMSSDSTEQHTRVLQLFVRVGCELQAWSEVLMAVLQATHISAAIRDELLRSFVGNLISQGKGAVLLELPLGQARPLVINMTLSFAFEALFYEVVPVDHICAALQALYSLEVAAMDFRAAASHMVTLYFALELQLQRTHRDDIIDTQRNALLSAITALGLVASSPAVGSRDGDIVWVPFSRAIRVPSQEDEQIMETRLIEDATTLSELRFLHASVSVWLEYLHSESTSEVAVVSRPSRKDSVDFLTDAGWFDDAISLASMQSDLPFAEKFKACQQVFRSLALVLASAVGSYDSVLPILARNQQGESQYSSAADQAWQLVRDLLGKFDGADTNYQYTAALYDELCKHGLSTVLDSDWAAFINMDNQACMEAVARVLVNYTSAKGPAKKLLSRLSQCSWVDHTLQSAKV
eukprot:m.13921 g.13921  ORF g.13921 m.13921 type:complete len:1360 (+) comp6071_c0_seq1:273-4352(+)